MRFVIPRPLKFWIALGCVLGAAAYLYAHRIHAFLAPREPIEAQMLVVEGWLPDDALRQAAVHFSENRYGLIVVVGGPLEQGFFLSELKTYAALGRATLIKISNRRDIVAVPSPGVRKDRTYASALALKKWMAAGNIGFRRINLLSLGVHARRSRYLFQKALGDQYAVGVIGLDPFEYDRHRWWRSSEGFKRVIDETLAYAYTRLLFPFADDLAP
jgi:hypothetical protein